MIDCVHYFVKCIEVSVVINLDGVPTRRLLGHVVTAIQNTPVGTLPASIVAVIKSDTTRSFLRFVIEAIAIFLFFDIPAS